MMVAKSHLKTEKEKNLKTSSSEEVRHEDAVIQHQHVTNLQSSRKESMSCHTRLYLNHN